MIRDADREAIEQFDLALRKPPPGVAAETVRSMPEWSAEEQGSTFLASLASRGALGGSTAP